MANQITGIARWIGFVGDLLSRECLDELPHERIFDELLATFAVDGVACSWSSPDKQPEMITRPVGVLAPLGDLRRSWRRDELLRRHPLACWYLTTGDISPMTIGRVPSSVVSVRTREPVMGCLRRIGLEQQLSIAYHLEPTRHGVYVLGRSGSDFSDADLAVATQIQRALIGLDRHVLVLRRLRRPGAGVDLDAGLTGRETCVLGLLAAGHSTQAIAHRLQCSPRTVNKHLEHLYRKLAVSDRLNAVRVARSWGLV